MRITDIIAKKQHGKTLTKEEIDFFLKGYVKGDIPDYQAAALMMAVWFQDMDSRETTDLTLSMAASGDQIDLSAIEGIKVDKHSTGGVADTTTLIVAPLVAACGGKVAKMSGRGLGHTGGTLDKLESIPGFNVNQTMDRFAEIVRISGLSIIGQTADLVPADKKLYALRDVTSTIDSIPLIASSIMSKKIAAGSNAIVLDVKTGSGAFMQEPEESKKLAQLMVKIGALAGRKTMALVTDMSQPLGMAIGNSIEVREAVEILQGEHSERALRFVSFSLAAQMLILSGLYTDESTAQLALENAVEDRSGLAKFAEMIEMQGGDPKICEDVTRLPKAEEEVSIKAQKSGYIGSMDTAAIGTAAQMLGAGRAKKEDTIDPAVGIWMKQRLGSPVEKGDEIAVFHVNDRNNFEESKQRFLDAVQIKNTPVKKPKLVYAKIQE
ncbi:MAG: pyrimidine-nucleoside phosphorylase [Spirochaetia bacterium]